MLACAVVVMAGFLAHPTSAQEPLKAPMKVVTASETVTMAPRAGLLQRLRGPRATTTVVRGVSAMQTTPAVTQAQGVGTTMTTQTPVLETRLGLMSKVRGRLGR